jgi:hypothetical protein
MNIGLFKKPRFSSLLITLYFCGVVISACVLSTLETNSTLQALALTYRVVGVTLFAGIVALYFSARTRTERVVYLNRKDVNTDRLNQAVADQSLIDPTAVTSIVNSRKDVPQRVLNEICNRVGAGQGAIYTNRNGLLELTQGYALGYDRKAVAYNIGEGIVGRVAAEGWRLCLDRVPEGYINVFSGLGNSSPTQLVLAPVKENDEVRGVIEIACFQTLNEQTLKDIDECAGALATAIF